LDTQKYKKQALIEKRKGEVFDKEGKRKEGTCSITDEMEPSNLNRMSYIYMLAFYALQA
jgi:hypothetical protein